MLTALQASKEVGLSKEAILKSIKGKRLSAQKDGKGQWSIDPAELFRVYPPVGTNDSNGTQKSIVSADGTQQEIAYLWDRCKSLEKQLEKRDVDVEDYRRRLDESDRRYIALLPSPAEAQVQKPPTLWQWLTGGKTA